MIGLDTNILVRLLVADNPEQTRAARRFVDTRCTEESPGFINAVVLAELVWVLTNVYGYRRAQVADTVETLLVGADRLIESHNEVRAALSDFKTGAVDFVDCMIGRVNRARGCDATATFDRRAAKLDGFMAVA